MQKHTERRQLNNEGFSLIELLIAIVILSIIVVPLLHSFVTSARTNAKSRNTMHATAIAEDVMEQFEAHTLEEMADTYEAATPTGFTNSVQKDASLDVDGDGYREMPDGSPMDILVSPQNSSTRREVYLRIAEVMVQNLDAIGVKAHVDEQSITNEEYEDQLCKEGTYQIFICYCTSGMASQTSCYYYFIDNTLDGNWGTCDLPEFVEAYETRRQASDEKAYIEGTKLLQQINAEQYIGEALCWDKAYFPYRTDKYEGWTNYPGWGVINCETWYSLRPVR